MMNFLPHPDYILMADCIYYEQVMLCLVPAFFFTLNEFLY